MDTVEREKRLNCSKIRISARLEDKDANKKRDKHSKHFKGTNKTAAGIQEMVANFNNFLR